MTSSPNPPKDSPLFKDPSPRSSSGTSFRSSTMKKHRRDASWFGSSSSFDVQQSGPLRHVSYDDKNHLSVLFQMHGSVWPKVLPYCLLNVLITYLAFFFKMRGFDMTFSPSGHKFMAIMVSFLVVSRANITYSRFMEARGYLATCYRCCRELVQHMCVLSMDDMTEGAKLWRRNVAYRTILLLRVTMASIEFQSKQQNPWEVPEIEEKEQKHIASLVLVKDDHITPEEKRVTKWAHGARTLSDESFRAPIILAYSLRKEIMCQRAGGFLKNRFRHVNEELKMLDYVTEFIQAFHGLDMLITTPFPFPLVQMARTFLFFWVFTLPFALCHNVSDHPHEPMLTIFFLSYGFMGLEYVSMELDDPYGDDPNDFDDLGMAQIAFEDIYIALYKCDGEKSAFQLRKRIAGRMKKGSAFDNFQKDYQYGYISPSRSEEEGNTVV